MTSEEYRKGFLKCFTMDELTNSMLDMLQCCDVMEATKIINVATDAAVELFPERKLVTWIEENG